MLNPALHPDQLDRYAALLGVEKRPPTLETLRELVLAQLTHVPFENIAKLYYHKRDGFKGLTPLERHLDGIERYHFGGTCHANNYYFGSLLRYLGYDCITCGADMNEPDCHVVNVVIVEGARYLIDCGYAAPFLSPILLDNGETTIPHGPDTYVIQPRDTSGRPRVNVYRDGSIRHGYWVNVVSREINHFEQTILDSYLPTSAFMGSILIVRNYHDRSVRLHNLKLYDIHGSDYTETELPDLPALVAAIEEHFEIPREMTEMAVAGMDFDSHQL